MVTLKGSITGLNVENEPRMKRRWNRKFVSTIMKK